MPHIEYAGGISLAGVNESRAAVIARAPAWWRELASKPARGAVSPPARPSARPTGQKPVARRWEGWGFVAGVIAPGLSVPAYSNDDGLRLREQFTPECWAKVVEHIRGNKRPVHLRLGHDGPILAESGTEHMTFRIHPLFGMGLTFTARLRSGSIPADAAKALESGGMGVSIGYALSKSRVVERDGVGAVRVVTECLVDHVALLKPGEQRAAYPGARCFGRAGKVVICPQDVRDRAEVFAYNELKRQAGIKV